MLAIHPPFPVFFSRSGKPLENGYVYFGIAGLNPLTDPKTVYWDAELTQPAAQPIRTMGGYPIRNGTPAQVFVDARYSLLVNDSKGALVYYVETQIPYVDGETLTNGDAVTDYFAGDGATVTFTLTQDPGSIDNIDVIVDGIWLTPRVDFTKAGKVLSLVGIVPETPTDPLENNIVIRYSRSVAPGSLNGAALEQLNELFVPLTAIDVKDTTPIPHLGVGISAVDESLAVIKGTTSRDSTGIGSLVQIQREYDLPEAWSGNKNTLRVLTTVGDGTAQAIGGPVWSISAEATGSANATIAGDLTALSAVTKKYASGMNAIAGHFQVRCPVIYVDPADVSPCVGAELNMPVVGLDNPTANNGAGNRHTMTLFARTDRTVSGSPGFADGETGSAIFIQHTQGDDASEGVGYYRYGIIIRDHVNHAGAHALTESALRIDTWGKYGIFMSSGHTLANIFLDEGSATYGYPNYGLVCNSDHYTSGTAIRINAGQYLAFDATNSVKMKYDSGLNQIIFEKGGVVRGHIDLAGADHAL